MKKNSAFLLSILVLIWVPEKLQAQKVYAFTEDSTSAEAGFCSLYTHYALLGEDVKSRMYEQLPTLLRKEWYSIEDIYLNYICRKYEDQYFGYDVYCIWVLGTSPPSYYFLGLKGREIIEISGFTIDRNYRKDKGDYSYENYSKLVLTLFFLENPIYPINSVYSKTEMRNGEIQVIIKSVWEYKVNSNSQQSIEFWQFTFQGNSLLDVRKLESKKF